MQLLGDLDLWRVGTGALDTIATRLRSTSQLCEQTGNYRVAATLLRQLCGSEDAGITRAGSTRLLIKDHLKLAEVYWRHRAVDAGKEPRVEAMKTLDAARRLLNELVEADLLLLPASTLSVLDSPFFSFSRHKSLSPGVLAVKSYEQVLKGLPRRDSATPNPKAPRIASSSGDVWQSGSELQESVTHIMHMDDLLMVASLLQGLAVARLIHNVSRDGDEVILALLQEAMALYEQAGANEKVAETIHAIGSLSQEQGKAEDDPLRKERLLQTAEKDFQRALELRQAALKQSELVFGGSCRVEHLLALAQSHITLGNLYLGMGDQLESSTIDASLKQKALYDQANEQLLQAADAYTRATHPKHVKVAYAVEGLAKVSFKQNRLADAMGWYEEALSIWSAASDVSEGSHSKQMESAVIAIREIQAKLGQGHKNAKWQGTYHRDTNAIRFVLRAAQAVDQHGEATQAKD